jgi:hypothetical protein
MCEIDFTICLQHRLGSYFSQWECIHGFPDEKSSSDFLFDEMDKGKVHSSRLFVYNRCWPEFVKKYISRRRLQSEIKIEHKYYSE